MKAMQLKKGTFTNAHWLQETQMWWEVRYKPERDLLTNTLSWVKLGRERWNTPECCISIRSARGDFNVRSAVHQGATRCHSCHRGCWTVNVLHISSQLHVCVPSPFMISVCHPWGFPGGFYFDSSCPSLRFLFRSGTRSLAFTRLSRW